MRATKLLQPQLQELAIRVPLLKDIVASPDVAGRGLQRIPAEAVTDELGKWTCSQAQHSCGLGLKGPARAIHILCQWGCPLPAVVQVLWINHKLAIDPLELRELPHWLQVLLALPKVLHCVLQQARGGVVIHLDQGADLQGSKGF